ncbi:MAG TPA: hypothetical protein PLY66_12735 [Acidobacteriota bacterium]|nr:hypothetical protein [Acidobacteriota bacterium]HQF87927.1 hypothetical protein [Acidobacteriota bacterium]HQG92263.1 hypothetical protein [Acidobacteriota bacterium]
MSSARGTAIGPTLMAVVAALLAAAHFSRADQWSLLAVSLAAPLLLALPGRWPVRLLQVLLLGAAAEWVRTAARLTAGRMAAGEPWLRLVVILAAVAAVTVIAAWLQGRTAGRRPAEAPGAEGVTVAAFAIASVTMGAAHSMVRPPILLAERFLAGAGWLEIAALALYAARLARHLADGDRWAERRRWLWGLFSVVFFAQLALGLAGLAGFLMSGKLHLPVPALIAAGPVWRGGGFFMPILFLATVVLVGPAWCSFLCYIGAWDAALAAQRPRPLELPAWTRWGRWITLPGVALAALGLRLTGAPPLAATAAAAAFGLAGVGIILTVSRRYGIMAHCTTWCPMGLVAALLGRLHPLRIRIGKECTECCRCTAACRYGALAADDIRRRRPGLNCTLCGDCVESCHGGWIGYRFPGLSSHTARLLFIALAAALHAACLGLARI